MGKEIMRCATPVVTLMYRCLKRKVPEYSLQAGCSREVGKYLKEKGYKRTLVVMDPSIHRLGLAASVIEGLEEEKITYRIFDRILPNPTGDMCKEGRELGLRMKADSLVAVGGGSVLDCAKLIATGIAQPKTSMRKLCRILIPRKIIPHIAVPTTAGTGAESSMGAVITDKKTHRKITAGSPLFIYDHVFLDAELTRGLPPKLSAAFGIDALSHAVESYLSRVNDDYGHECALETVKLIFENLPAVCRDGNDLQAREKMAYAAMRGGTCININYAGLAHPFAHAIGGKYNLPHGEMIAATLVCVLRFEEDRCEDKLAALCVACGFGTERENKHTLAVRFVDKVQELRDSLGLSGKIPQIKKADIPEIISNMYKDAFTYPVPKLISRAEAEAILRKLRN